MKVNKKQSHNKKKHRQSEADSQDPMISQQDSSNTNSSFGPFPDDIDPSDPDIIDIPVNPQRGIDPDQDGDMDDDGEEEEEEEENTNQDEAENVSIKIANLDNNRLEDKYIQKSVICFYLGELKKGPTSDFSGSMTLQIHFGKKFSYRSPTLKLGSSATLKTFHKISIQIGQSLPANITIFLNEEGHITSRPVGVITIPIAGPDEVLHTAEAHQFDRWDRKKKAVVAGEKYDFTLSYRYFITSHVHSRRLLPPTTIRSTETFAYPSEPQNQLQSQLKAQFAPGDLILYNFPGHVAGLTKVKYGCNWSHCGLVVTVPNKWTGRPQLAVMELTRNREAFYDIYSETPLYDGVPLFDLGERLHGAPGLEIWRARYTGRKGGENEVKNLACAVLALHDEFVAALSGKKKYALPFDFGLLKFTDSEKSFVKNVKGNVGNYVEFLELFSPMLCARLLADGLGEHRLDTSEYIDIQSLVASGCFEQPVLVRCRKQFMENIYWPLSPPKVLTKKPSSAAVPGKQPMAVDKTPSLADLRRSRSSFNSSKVRTHDIRANATMRFSQQNASLSSSNSSAPSSPPPPQNIQQVQQPPSPQCQVLPTSQQQQQQQQFHSPSPLVIPPPLSVVPPPLPVGAQLTQNTQSPRPSHSLGQSHSPKPAIVTSSSPLAGSGSGSCGGGSAGVGVVPLGIQADPEQNIAEEKERIVKLMEVENRAIEELQMLKRFVPYTYEEKLEEILSNMKENYAFFKRLQDALTREGRELTDKELAKAQERTDFHKGVCKEFDGLIEAFEKFKATEEPKMKAQVNDLDMWASGIKESLGYMWNNAGHLADEAAKSRAFKLYNDLKEVYNTMCGAKQYILNYRIPLPPELSQRVLAEQQRYRDISNEAGAIYGVLQQPKQ